MEFLRWYRSMLESLLPRWLRMRMETRERGLVVIADPAVPSAARIAGGKRGGEQVIGSAGQPPAWLPAAARAGLTLVLTGSPVTILTRRITLPLAVERDLPAVIGFEMDRLTPFDASEVLFRAEILRRDRAAGTIRLGLAVLPRRLIEPVIDVLAGAGLRPTRVDVRDNEGGRFAFALDGSAGRPARLLLPLAIVCAGLTLLCLAIPLARQQIAIAALASQQAALAPRLRTAEALRSRLGEAGALQASLGAERAREGDMLASLAAITRAIPDHSFLTDLVIRRRLATLDGESPNAAGLVARLSADPAFADPAFSAPVTRALNESADIFAIQVRLHPAMPPKTAPHPDAVLSRAPPAQATR